MTRKMMTVIAQWATVVSYEHEKEQVEIQSVICLVDDMSIYHILLRKCGARLHMEI